MFAVPGWSLSSASPRTQTDAPGAQTNTLVANGSSSGKRRKRGGTKGHGPEVTGANLAELWHQHIERRSAGPLQKSSGTRAKHGNKRRKTDRSRNDIIQNDPISVDPFSRERGHGRGPGQGKESEKDRNAERRERQDQCQKVGHVVAPPSTALPDEALFPAAEPSAAATTVPKATVGLTPLQASMRQKLTAARFRHLNQTLYTTPSATAFNMFAKNPELFEEYHTGFRQQVAVWPENPLAGYAEELRLRGGVEPADNYGKHGKGRPQRQGDSRQANSTDRQPLPRTHGRCTIADLGCGDAELAERIAPFLNDLKLRIYSFDLSSQNPSVTKADIANLPLEDSEVNVAILCLALMGTNWVDFIDEAWRVLHWKGELWVAEIKSRFRRAANKRLAHSIGNRQKKPVRDDEKNSDDEGKAQLAADVESVEPGAETTDVSAFVTVLQTRGFALQQQSAVDHSNKMFVKMKFTKSLTPVKGKNASIPQDNPSTAATWRRKVPKGKLVDEGGPGDIDESAILKPCVYKLR